MVADTEGKSLKQIPKVGRVSKAEHIYSSLENDEVYVF